MKKSIVVILLAVGFALASGTAEAQRTSKRAAEQPVQTQMSAPERGGHSSSTSFGVGVSTISPIPARGTGVDGSLTGFIGLTGLDTVQLFASIPSTSGTFQFGVGGVYKRTVFGNGSGGLHLGGGLGIGTNGDFAMNVLGVVGVHYMPSGSSIAFHLDGGPVLNISKISGGATTTTTDPNTGATTTTGGSSTQTNFGMGSYSTVLGASVAYMF